MTQFSMWGNVLTEEELYNYYAANRVSGDYIVGSTYIGNLWISTVYLPANHNWYDQNNPVMFETIVFNTNDAYDDPMFRHSLYIDALIGHAMIVGTYRVGRELTA